MQTIIIDVDRRLADNTAEFLEISRLDYMFLPMAACAIHLKNGIEINGRTVVVPSEITRATHGTKLVQQLKKAKTYITENGGTVQECNTPGNHVGRRESQKVKLGE